MKFQPLFKHFIVMKHYFIAAALVFAVSIYLGSAYSGSFSNFLEGQMEGLKKLGQSLNSKDHVQLWSFGIIFLNNVIKSVIIVFLGLLFGILPLFMIIANGMILGYIISIQTHQSIFALIVKGILPHGIIEIPAILLACAYGLKLGMLVWKCGIQLFLPPQARTAYTELLNVLKLTKPLVVLIVIALLVAAIIESTLTYWLVRM